MMRACVSRLIKCKVNGKAADLKPGKLLAALRAIGEKVPSVCWHEDLPTSGGRCRVCMCEVNGRLVPSCNSDVVEGSDIVTNSTKVMNLRKAALALVPNMPDAQGPAQDIEGVTHGSTAKHEHSSSVVLPAGSNYIIRHPELCTHCGLCVAMCQSIQGVGAIASARKANPADMAAAVGEEGGIITFHNKALTATECINCGQCINVCPYGALEEASDLDLIEVALKDPARLKVFQFAPAVRIALAEEFGYAPGTRSLTHEMVAATRRLGKNVHVFDTNFTADLTIMEEGYELLERLRRVLTGEKMFGGDHMETALPMMTSCSPAWVLFCEKNYHDMLPHISSCKSPQQMHGALTKHFWAKQIGVAPKDLVSISVMPCVAKKGEKDRPEFSTDGVKDVDYVMTTREFAKLCKNHKIDPTKLEGEDFDTPFGIGTGAGVIFGATGGVMEAALRTVYEIITGREVPFSSLNIQPVRGMEYVREAAIPLAGLKPEWKFLEGVELKVAIVHGAGNARKLLDRIRERKEQGLPPEYHFIEVMGCPGGCLGGGGQPKPTSMEVKKARASLIYAEDEHLPFRKSHENPAVQQLYKEYLGEPLGEKSHHLLHTHYTARSVEHTSFLDSPGAQEVKQMLAGKPRVRSRVTNILSEIVDKYGYISDEAVAALADHIRVTPVDLDSIISHYHYFPRHQVPDSMLYLCECVNCRLNGSGEVKAFLKQNNIPFHMTSWLGWCVNGAPAALIKHKGDPNVHAMYNITKGDARLEDLASFKNPNPGVNFEVLSSERFGKSAPSVLRNLNLSSSDQFFLAESKACPVTNKMRRMDAEEIIEEIRLSGLRGCGGAGFPSRFKWAAVRAHPSSTKYIVINADEGLPNTFKDYYLLHDDNCRMRMMCGIGIAAHTVGAKKAVLYLRYEYKNLKPALEATFAEYVKLHPTLTKDFKFEVVLGGGPYICGEETALFESVEGHLPQARCDRSVFPTHQGLFGQPTLVGNVETFSWVPSIIYSGGQHFASFGAKTEPNQQGLKLFSISGDVKKPVLGEWPMGTSLRSILEEAAGIPVEDIAAVEVGGMLESLTWPDEFDKLVSLDNAPNHLAGGGSIVVFSKQKFNERKIYIAKAKFANIESCQLCAPCREGTQVFRNAIGAMLDGTVKGTPALWLKMKELSAAMEMSSNCGHGKACGKFNRLLMERLEKK